MRAARPAHGATQGGDQLGQYLFGVGLLTHDRSHLAFELQELLLLILAGDGPPDPAIPSELSGCIKGWSAVERDPMQIALRIPHPEFEVFERPLRLHIGLMLVPVDLMQIERIKLPAAFAEGGTRPLAAQRAHDTVRDIAHPVVCIGLPHPVRRQLRQVTKLRFARGELLRHRTHGGDVLHDAGEPAHAPAAPTFGACHAAHPDLVAVRAAKAVFNACFIALSDGASVRVLPAFAVLGVDPLKECPRIKRVSPWFAAEQTMRAVAPEIPLRGEIEHPRPHDREAFGGAVLGLESVKASSDIATAVEALKDAQQHETDQA